ncbi:MAG TPA: hypothetical protein VFL83_09785 [Anaeromyxobacter sp.]|nr:hypothetical protein [Anaeromyxobacter sp.]
MPQPAVEKLGQGDRAYLAGDYRNALFAYQDAVYLAPKSAAARVRLGRAYLALRYPAQATVQGEQALALDPENADARQLIDDARSAPARQVAPQPGRTGATAAAAPAMAAPRNGASGATAGAAAAGPRVYPFAETEPDPAARGAAAGGTTATSTPDATSAQNSGASSAPTPTATPSSPAGAASTSASVAPAAVAVVAAGATAAPSDGAAGAPVNDAPATFGVQREFDAVKVGGTAADARLARLAAPDPAGPTAGQRYRTALELLANREYEKAVAELTQAIVLDPRLAVAYAARASARFGLGRYREAADDYRTSLAIDENLGTPLYGLAECYRVLGDGRRAAEMYQKYAASRAPDVREDLRAISAKRAQELRF